MQFQEHIGTPINVTYEDPYRIPSVIDSQLSGWAEQDVWIVDGASIPALAYRKALLALDDMITSDPAVDWPGFQPLWASLAVADNRTISMPMDSDVLLMFYRADILSSWNMSVPSTWEELAQLVASWNTRSATSAAPAAATTGATAPTPRHGLCLSPEPLCTSSALLSAILASMTQRYGPHSGWALALEQPNPDLAVQLVNGSAMYAALSTYRLLMRQTPDDLSCSQSLSMFASGDCLVTLNMGRHFKALQGGESVVRGAVGVALPPGSSQVLDRMRGVLVTAGEQSCRVPTRSALNGAWVCSAPFLSYGGTFGVIGFRNGAVYQHLGFQFLTFLTSLEAQWDGALDLASPLEPVRTSMMQPAAAAVMAKVGAAEGFGGYDLADAEAYLAALRAAFWSPNAALEFGAPGAINLRSYMEAAIEEYMLGTPAEVVADRMLGNWLQEWALLGYSVAQVQELLIKATPDPFAIPQPEDDDHQQMVGWAIAVGLVGALALLAVAISVASCHCFGAGESMLRRIVPPMVAAETTLVVTDIEDSTKLWEMLSSDVMDSSIYHHHSLARRLILKFGGYESATEGDSFIVAFHTADDAVCFCSLFQQELLLVPWPVELLVLEGCRAIWMCKSEIEPKRRRNSQQNTQLEVTRSEAPLSGLMLAGSHVNMGLRPSNPRPETLNRSEPDNSINLTTDIQIQGSGTLGLGPGSGPGTPGNIHISSGYTPPALTSNLAYGSGTETLNLGHPPSPSASASPSASMAPVVSPRFSRSTAPYTMATTVPGGVATMGALGASPRQLSFLGRSVSRLGASSLTAAGAGVGTPSHAAAQFGGLERYSARREISCPSVSNGPPGGQHDLGGRMPGFQRAATAIAGGGGEEAGGGGEGASSSAARAGFAAGGVMSFRESFRGDCNRVSVAPLRASGSGGTLSERLEDDNDNDDVVIPTPKSPMLTGYPSTSSLALQVAQDIGEEASAVNGRGRLTGNGARTIVHRNSTDTLDGVGEGADRTTTNSRHSRSTEIATVSEFNVGMESGGQPFVHRRSEADVVQVGNPWVGPRGPPHAALAPPPPSPPQAAAQGAVTGLRAEMLARAGMGPMSEGGRAAAPAGPPAALRRSSVTFDFHAVGTTSSGEDAGGGSSGGGATAALTPTMPTKAQHSLLSLISPQLAVGAGPVSSADQSGNESPSQASYTSPPSSQRSSRPSPVAYRRAPSHQRPVASAAPPPLPFGSRAASLRRRSDISVASGFGGADCASPYITAVATAVMYGHGHDSALRPSPLGRGSSHISGFTAFRTHHVENHGGSEGTGGHNSINRNSSNRNSSNNRSLRGPSVDGDDASEGHLLGQRGQSSPLPQLFAAGPISEDEVVSGAPSAEGHIVNVPRAATTIRGGGGDGSHTPGAGGVFAISGRINTGPRSLTQALPHMSNYSIPLNSIPISINTAPAAGLRASTPSNAGMGRSIFNLVSLPSPRPGAAAALLSLGLGNSNHVALPIDSRGASMASMMRLASKHNLQSVGDSLCSRWRVVEEGDVGAQLVFRGLRVRMGVHSGLSESTDSAQLNRTANRMQYTGLGLQMAKAVGDCAHGGQVLMSEAAFTQLAVESLKERVMVLHMGEHRMKEELPNTSLYCGCPRALQGRLPALRTVRSRQQHSMGVLEAPAGLVVVVFMHVVGAMSLLDWRTDLAHSALAMFRDHVTLELIKYQGYLVEAVDGLVLASFSSPSSALRWIAKCQHDMTMLPWPQELLCHEACEELCMTKLNPATGVQEEVVIFRGLRLKAGVDMGRLRGEINCVTGRMSYRGRAMNRAARIVAAAGSGQILASSEAWLATSSQAAARICGLTGSSMGQFILKGVTEPIEVFLIKTAAGVVSRRAKTMLASPVDPLDMDELPIADPAAALQHHVNINNATSAAAAVASAVLARQISATSANALRAGSGTTAGGGVPARLMLERVHSMSGGLAAALRREESMSRRGSLSRQLSRNASMRSSRRSSVGSQYSTLAAITMVAVARGSYDGRQELAPHPRSGAAPHVTAPQVTTFSTGGGTLLAPVMQSQRSASQPQLQHATSGHNQPSAVLTGAPNIGGGGGMAPLQASASAYLNTVGSMGSHGGGSNTNYDLPSVGSGTRTSRNSAGEPGDTDGNRSSNPRSSNASHRSANPNPRLLSMQPPSLAHLQQGTASPVATRTAGSQGLVRHLSTLIRSASLALYGSSGTHASGPASSACHPPVVPSMQAVGVALAPGVESMFDTGSIGRGERSTRPGDRAHREGSSTGIDLAATYGGPGPAGPSGTAATGLGLRDLLPARLRAAGGLFRGGSFSGHVRRRVEDGARTSDYGESHAGRRTRSPAGRHQPSTASGIGYIASVGQPSGMAGGLLNSPSRSSGHRSAAGYLRRDALADRVGVASTSRSGRRQSRQGAVERLDMAGDSFVIVVGDEDPEGESDDSAGGVGIPAATASHGGLQDAGGSEGAGAAAHQDNAGWPQQPAMGGGLGLRQRPSVEAVSVSTTLLNLNSGGGGAGGGGVSGVSAATLALTALAGASAGTPPGPANIT